MSPNQIAKTFRACLLISTIVFSFTHRASAQAGAVYTVVGGGSSTADGVPATSSMVTNATGIGMDAAGNFYFADRGRYVVRKVDGGSGLVYTVAGIAGSFGSSGDGGPATAARLNSNIRGIHVNAAGDILICDGDRIRKVNGSTGIITTVAGGGSSTADGVPATSSSIDVNFVYGDVADNIYLGTHDKIRKVDVTTGIITTLAGSGSSIIEGGDGGPATLAGISGSAKSICMDNAGNLYIISFGGNRVRKIDAATGIITTVAGGGSSTADGVPATDANFFDFHNCAVDGAGNIFIADWNGLKVRRVDAATGIISTIAGMTGGSSAEGTAALAASINPYMILVNPGSGHIFYSDFTSKVKKFSYSPMVPLIGGGASTPSDSLAAYIYRQCSGPQITVRTHSYYAGMTIRTYFGDGLADTSIVNASWSSIGGYALVDHAYSASGAYTITQVLCNATGAVDTLSYSYNHVFCATVSVKFYNDLDNDCVKSGTDPFLMNQVVTRVDSNGVPVDTLVATSGFNYFAYGTPGDIYRFSILSAPAALFTSCPVTGIVYDTLQVGVTTGATRYVGLNCGAASTADLQATAYVPVTGPNDQWGHIYVRNNYCPSADASVTLNFSPKYRYTGGANPMPASSSATSITWNLSSIMNTEAGPRDIYYVVWHNPAVPYPTDGDTVNEHIVVTPTAGAPDIIMSNNTVIRTDTVRTSCDPNAIEVSPACFDTDTTLHFTLHFENIGSAPAVNIYVLDTLSSLLDPSTLKIEMSSHPMFVTKNRVNGKTIFRFDFPNINLADSSDHINRDGMFMYTIKNIPMFTGMAAHSRVGIYFDYNDVLMTNTASATKGCPVTSLLVGNVETAAFNLFPNPATDELTITAQPGRYMQLTIANAVGQQVLQQGMNQQQVMVNVKHLPAGVYYVTCRGANGSDVRKFVKL